MREAPSIDAALLFSLAQQQGLDIVAVTSADPLEADAERLQAWQQAGYAGEMEYMQRPSSLLAVPQALLPEARSVVTVAVAYDRSPRPPCPPGFGLVARYAWGRDYHKLLRRRLERLCQEVERALGTTIRTRIFSDSVPLLERALAQRAGLGFIGKNTLLIIPGRGSLLLLAEVLWDVVVRDLPPTPRTAAHCGGCVQCLKSCPTGAFVEAKILDARRCISYLTIEKRGALSPQERPLLGEWVFGCDICQEVCPFNFLTLKRREPAALPELGASAGVGGVLELGRVLQIRTHEEFVATFGGTALMRATRPGLLRNAAIVAANTGASHLFELLCLAACEDSAGVVRQHALWGATSIAQREGTLAVEKVRELLQRGSLDPDTAVRVEAAALLASLG